MQQIRILISENETLRYMLAAIAAQGIVIALLTAVYAVTTESSLIYLILGLIIGVAVSIFMTIHLAYTIEAAVELSEKAATGKMRSQLAVRYVVACAAIIVCGVFKFASPITCIIGIFTMKFSAYIAQFMLKRKHKE